MQRMKEYRNPDNVPYLKGKSWTNMKYVFFPIHGGNDYEHFYVFGVDFEKREKFILNSLPCGKSFEKDLVFKPTGTRLMTYARPLLL
ncbi:hypothetical protein LINPERHAP1_LOCUS36593, partial [Linum perenne]